MKLFTVLLVTLLLACESSTSFGPCIGISEPYQSSFCRPKPNVRWGKNENLFQFALL